MTADEVRTVLRAEIQKAGSAKEWAAAHSMSAQIVSDTLNGRRDPAGAIMRALGLQRETIYYRAAQ